MKDFLELAKARYSVRKFDGGKPIEDEKMALILEAAKVAPSACTPRPLSSTSSLLKKAWRKPISLPPASSARIPY